MCRVLVLVLVLEGFSEVFYKGIEAEEELGCFFILVYLSEVFLVGFEPSGCVAAEV